MHIDDVIARVRDRAINRRDLNKAMAAAGILTVAAPVTGAKADADGEVIYFTWAGYDIPEIWPKYVEMHGAEPETPLFGDNAETFAKMRSGFQVDVTHPCAGSTIVRWRDAGLLQPIDTSRLSNWPDMVPALTNLEGSIVDGDNYFAPCEWGQTSITYRTDLVEVEEESWGILWDEQYAGKLTMLDAAEDAWFCAAIYAGIDMDNITDEGRAKVMELLRQQRPLLRNYTSDMTSVQQMLASGEVVAAMTWNGTPWELSAQEIPVRFADVKEGALTWVCGLVLAEGAPHYDKAHDLIDAMLDPSAGEFITGEYGYGHSNVKTYELFSDEELAARGLSRDVMGMLDRGVFVLMVDPAQNEAIERDWAEVTAGF